MTIATRTPQPLIGGQTMRAVEVRGPRDLGVIEVERPPAPGPGEVQVRIGAVALNHIDVWGWRGMAFARRKLPLIAGAEAAGEVVAIGPGVEQLQRGDLVALYGARTCGVCPACREGRDNFCIAADNIYGFHVDGFCRELMNIPARLAVKAPPGPDLIDAAVAPITFGTAEHMLFDNARLKEGETVLVHAGGSGIGSAAIQLAKAAGATVITTVGSEEKFARARALGADHVINYRQERFEGRVRQITGRRGVEVVFEHVGADTWEGSLLSLQRGGRLVTCGSTTGVTAKTNLFILFQQQLRLIGSFGCTMANMRTVMSKMAERRVQPVIDTEIPAEQLEKGLQRLESRQVFGKIIITL